MDTAVVTGQKTTEGGTGTLKVFFDVPKSLGTNEFNLTVSFVPS